MDKATFGLIGAGNISQSQHLPNLKRAPHIHFKTICDLRKDVLDEMQKKYQVPEATTDYKSLLADPEIQVVVIATKHDMHVPLTIEALHAGKNVYVEKPLGETREECESVVTAQKETGKYAVVGFNRRFAPSYVKAKEIMQKNGGPHNIHYRIADEYWSWGKHVPPRMRVIHELCHVFDILRWFTESEVKSVYCVESRADDEAYILKFESGCVASIMNSGFATIDFPKERIEIISKCGSVTVEDFVELRTYGFSDEKPVYKYAGHTHPDEEYAHKYLCEMLGAEALYAFRRMGWELREQLKNISEGKTIFDQAEIDRYIKETAPVWNYMSNKGWLNAVDDLACSIISGKVPKGALAEDGLMVSIITQAAIQSRETGQVIYL